MADRALVAVDLQKDFCEGGALAVAGGEAVTRAISYFVRGATSYKLKVASRDWHAPDSDNEGHFSDNPNWRTSWPAHCVAFTRGAEYHDLFPAHLFDRHIHKGFGNAGYSAFEGRDQQGMLLRQILCQQGITQVDIVGIATEYCVCATALEAAENGFKPRVILDLCAGITAKGSAHCFQELAARGVEIIRSSAADA